MSMTHQTEIADNCVVFHAHLNVDVLAGTLVHVWHCVHN